ncbi:MAG: hypothetical protein RJA36_3171 [Pseudomonadota bacterium]|jgi:glycerol-3-phosphate dehydrogenase
MSTASHSIDFKPPAPGSAPASGAAAAPVARRAGGSERSRLNPAQRALDLAAASAGTADVIVIGAGVTGAGAALDAAARGLSVVLVEAGDLAVGTSSRSGKAFHGGLRYLEQLNFKLVAHAIAERDLMVKRLCPHMAWPESFVYPLTRHWERPYVGAGVLLYDLFGLKERAVPLQKHFSRSGLKAHIPSIDDGSVVGGIQYYDALMDDARHTLAVARTAAGQGARVLTSAPVVDFVRDEQGRVGGVVIQDKVDGRRHVLRARSVINAAGIWADELQQLAGARTFRVQPAKGVHLLLRPEAIASNAGILARATDSVIIARRWYGYWLVGTTDTPWQGNKSRPVAERADIDYLLENLNRYLERKVTPDDVLGTFAGLRPLLKPVDGSDTTSALSRDHAVLDGPPGLTTIVGGKYTTYRRMAEDAVDAALRPLGVQARSRTATLPLLGAERWQETAARADAIAARHRLPPETVAHLFKRHGDCTEEVLALADPAAGGQAELARPLEGAPRYLAAELVYAVQSEGARSLVDVMVRRTHLSIELSDGGLALAPCVAGLIAPHLGWSAAQTEEQLRAYRELIAAERVALEECKRSVGSRSQA